MTSESPHQFTFWKVGQQEVHLDFIGGRIVSDAGLLAIREFDKKLGIVAGLANLFPDPRSQAHIKYSRETLLAQEVYQILAGYPDGDDANHLRDDPLFKTLLDIPPDDEKKSLPSGSTLNRFHNAFTRRDAGLPLEERPAQEDRQIALTQRINIANDYLIDLFIRTRIDPPSYVIIDLDASDDPTHGQQILSGYHGFYGQQQYLPLFFYDGETGFPLGGWLRPGTVGAACGAVDGLKRIVNRLRSAWPRVCIVVRGDNGFANPEMYEYCESESFLYVFGFATNDILKRRTDTWMSDYQLYYDIYGCRFEGPHQRFEVIDDYQAGTWYRPRRIVVKLEITPAGQNRRFVVTNISGHPQGIYQGIYVQRGDVPESPIGELKNGLEGDRLSSHSFRANGMKLVEYLLAFALLVLYREASALASPEMAKAEVTTWRQRLWKVGALVVTTGRRIWFHFSETWPYRDLWVRIHREVRAHVELLLGRAQGPPVTPPLMLM